MSANTILSEALKLPRAERAVIARSLFSSVDELDNPDDDISPELELELELDRILADMNANASSCIPFDQVEKELDELMRK